MPGSFSDYLEDALLDHVFGGGDFTRPATLYVAAYTAAPTDAGGGTEVAGGAYARVALTNNATNFPAATGGAKANGTLVEFPEASGSWGTVTAIGIFDADTAGNLLAWATLTANKAIESGDVLQVAAGDLDVTLD